MKKKTYVLLFIIAITWLSYSQNTTIPDPNFEQALINLGIDSGTVDGLVFTDNINSIQYLNIESKGITDLTGIEDFSALVRLDCRDNQLTNLNFSENTLLRELYCYDNVITSINVSQNILLRDLHCRNNQIATLNISQNTALNNLDISTNLLTSLDISNNTELRDFNCRLNQLTTLDLTLHSNLQYILCDNNALNYLNLNNGNNVNVLTYNSSNNPDLDCIIVDNSNYSETNWTNIDPTSTFVETTAECPNCNVNVDTLPNNTSCESYILPNLTNGMYFSETFGNGTQFNPGDVITSSQTIYIYIESPSDNTCFNQTSFTVTISPIPVDTLENVEVCENYILQPITNGNYYTETGGNGTALAFGDSITNSQTIYIYNQDPTNINCFNESSFEVTILPIDNFNLDSSNVSINGTSISVINLNPVDNYLYAIDNTNYQNSNTFTGLSLGLHTLNVSTTNGCVEKSITFNITNNLNISIPLFFTPNNDGINDLWSILDFNNSIKHTIIYNRYGKVIKTLLPNNYGWDGTYNGILLENNDYWYKIIFKNREEKVGHFTLKR